MPTSALLPARTRIGDQGSGIRDQASVPPVGADAHIGPSPRTHEDRGSGIRHHQTSGSSVAPAICRPDEAPGIRPDAPAVGDGSPVPPAGTSAPAAPAICRPDASPVGAVIGRPPKAPMSDFVGAAHPSGVEPHPARSNAQHPAGCIGFTPVPVNTSESDIKG